MEDCRAPTDIDTAQCPQVVLNFPLKRNRTEQFLRAVFELIVQVYAHDVRIASNKAICEVFTLFDYIESKMFLFF